MRDIPIEVAAEVARRDGIVVRNLLWVKGRNRTTGEYENIGFWNGGDVRVFVISGETRTYYGTGAFIKFGSLSSETGLVIKKLTGIVSPFAAEVQQALREYEPRFAPVEAHQAFFSPDTMQMVADPVRMFKGWIDTVSIKEPVINGNDATATINMVGHTRILTRLLQSLRSNESQKKRNSSDTFYTDVAVSAELTTPWGSS